MNTVIIEADQQIEIICLIELQYNTNNTIPLFNVVNVLS